MTELSSEEFIGIDPVNVNFKDQRNPKEFMGGIILLIGPSCVGKNTFIKRLIGGAIPDLEFGVSTTSREAQIRNGHLEIHGVHYYFRGERAFQKKQDFIEMNCYAGNYYGVEVAEIRRVFNGRHHFITDIDVNGAKKFITHHEFGEHTFSIFIDPGSVEILRAWILMRQPNIDPLDLERRLQEYENEKSQIDWFDVVIKNDIDGDLETPYQAIKSEIEKFLASLPK